MIKIDQIVALIRSHLNHDDEQFRSIALQMSAEEARSGHSAAAIKIHKAITSVSKSSAFNLRDLNGDVADLFIAGEKRYSLLDMFLSDDTKAKIKRIITEYILQDKLHQYNLDNRRKILLYGNPGTGKTMTAEVLAKELNLPFIVVKTEKVISKFLGETGLKLSKVFDVINKVQAVYLFDEFDAIGSQRGMENDVGEQRRILNTFLQLLDRDQSHSLIIAATNNVDILDKALFRRFDDTIEYKLPNEDLIVPMLKELFCSVQKIDIYSLSTKFVGMNQAEIKKICQNALKDSILNGRELSNDAVEMAIAEAKSLDIKYA
jgi:SpoVK/Ycf46/Vps4 family AAA+-type ATPase